MPPQSTIRLLQRSLQDQLMIKMELTVPSLQPLYGIVVGMTPDLVLMRVEVDFRDDGFHALPTATIHRAERSRSVIYWQGMMEQEKLIPENQECPEWVDLTGWTSLFEALKARKQVCTVDSEDPDNRLNDELLIGRVIRVAKKRAWFHAFDAQARWDREPTPVELSAVTSVRWDDHYSTVYSRHLPPLA